VRESIDFDFDVYLPSIEKNLQRPLVWTLEQKQALIFTILRDQKLNSIVVVQVKGHEQKENYLFKVIDGKQRLTTLFGFIDNDFAIVVNNKTYYYRDLPSDCQRQITGYYLTWDVHYHYEDEPITDQTLIDMFEEVNFLGTPQDIEHLNSLKQWTR
jgi:uncharacterized protein with ParB-like and HNH nuclease domain